MSFQSSPNRLAVLRKQNGLSQKQLAALVGQHYSMISIYERGRALPRLPIAGMLQLLFGVRIAEIFPALFDKLAQELESRRISIRQRLPERVELQ